MSLLPVLLFVLCITGCGAQARERTTVNGKVGGSVTFTAHHGSQASEITWKIGGDKYGEVEANRQHFYRNDERSTMDLQSGNFTINRLAKSDAGNYTAEVLISGTVHYRYFTLHIYDELTKPKVNCSFLKDDNYTLSCTYPSKDVNLSWIDIDNCQSTVCTIPYYKEEVTCIARNPVSESQNTTRCPPRKEQKADEQQNSPMLSRTGSNDQTNTADTNMKKAEAPSSDDTPI